MQSKPRNLARLTTAEAYEVLRKAYAENRLTLYLGAGVSVGNGVPNWQKLVLAMYFSAIADEYMEEGRRPFPNYLYAIAEWHLERVHEPLDITARRIRKYYQDKDSNAFVNHLRKTLYAGFVSPDGTGFHHLKAEDVRNGNQTLNAVVDLCVGSTVGSRGVRSVVTENYDSLLEIALGDYPDPPFQTIWKPEKLEREKLPIYHVHGYVPIEGEGSSDQELVFTEEQYHLAARDAYSWSSLVQIQCMSSTIGLMIGLSLSDRNMRRLLDAVMSTPVGSENFALLREPHWGQPTNVQLEQIHDNAMKYFNDFDRSGVKRLDELGRSPDDQIIDILGQVEHLDKEQQTFVLEQLGVHPIWYKQHTEIPYIIRNIMAS